LTFFAPFKQYTFAPNTMLGKGPLKQDFELLPLVEQDSAFSRSSVCVTSGRSSVFSRNNDDDSLKRNKTCREDSLFQGWRFTLFLAFVSSLVVLFFNLGFLIYAATHPTDGDRRVLYDGECDKAETISTGFHVLINFLSTALLSASNFGMVILP
jgi:hypothetical protein